MSTRPNILLIMTDQQSYATMAASVMNSQDMFKDHYSHPERPHLPGHSAGGSYA